MNNPTRIAVFLSGGGSNLQALIDGTKIGILSGKIAWVVSSMRKAYGLERAKNENIETFVYKIKGSNTGIQEERLTIKLVELEKVLELSTDNINPESEELTVNI